MKLRRDLIYSVLMFVVIFVAMAAVFGQTPESNTHIFLLLASVSILGGIALRSDIRLRFFILACVLLLAATVLFERQEPLLHLDEFTAWLQANLRLDLPNLDNVVLGIPLLLLSGFYFIRALPVPPIRQVTPTWSRSFRSWRFSSPSASAPASICSVKGCPCRSASTRKPS